MLAVLAAVAGFILRYSLLWISLGVLLIGIGMMSVPLALIVAGALGTLMWTRVTGWGWNRA